MKFALILFLLALCWLAQARYTGNRFRRDDNNVKGDDKKSDAEQTPTDVEFWLRNLIVGPPAGAPHITLNVNSKLDDNFSDAILKGIYDRKDNEANHQNEKQSVPTGKENDEKDQRENNNETDNGSGSDGHDKENNKNNNNDGKDNKNNKSVGPPNSGENKQSSGNRNRGSNSNEIKNVRDKAVATTVKDNSDSSSKRNQESKKTSDESKKPRAQDETKSELLNEPNGYSFR